MIEIIPMTIQHAYELAKNLREDDRLECEALGHTPRESLRKSYYESFLRKTLIIDDKPAACFGLSGSSLGYVAHPWLLTSPLVEGCYVKLALLYRDHVREMLTMFPRLENFCDSRYDKSLNLLKLIGFRIEEPMPFGKLKKPFCRFWIEA